MLNVFFSVDVEIWCDGWQNIDEKFPAAFQKYIYGSTARGNYGLPYQLKVLEDNGLTGVFFIEPLFALRFGKEPLEEVVGLVKEKSQEVQLHLHTEWVDESTIPLFDGPQKKRQHLRYFSLDEQEILIEKGAALLKSAGAEYVNAFRAGSFAFNKDTLIALERNGFVFDSSYNASLFGLDSGVMPGVSVVEPVKCEGIYEYPMAVFRDGTRSLRHAQLTACTFGEIESLLWQAVEAERTSFVILSHGFECLNNTKNRPDDVVLKRFERLCSLLANNSDSFCVRGFHELSPHDSSQQPEPLVSPLWKTGLRVIEQVYRRRFK